MDVTKEYIKMMEKATKIQEEWIPKWDDFEHHKLMNNVSIIAFGHPDFRSYIARDCVDKKYSIWLPRQDQLQAMMYESEKDKEGYEMGMLNLWESFRDFVESDYPDGHFMNCINFFDTFEKAWLMFVMLIKYNKIWSGQDWVKVEKRLKEFVSHHAKKPPQITDGED